MGAITDDDGFEFELVEDDDGFTEDEAYALLAGVGPHTSELPLPQVASRRSRTLPEYLIYGKTAA